MSNGKITKLQINMAKIEENIGFIKEALVKNDDQHKELIGSIKEIDVKIDGFVQSADDRFAAKKDHSDSMTKMDGIMTTIDSKFVTKEEFSPIKKLAYGFAGAIILAVLYAIVQSVLK
jgi:hypothetical protein